MRLHRWNACNAYTRWGQRITAAYCDRSKAIGFVDHDRGLDGWLADGSCEGGQEATLAQWSDEPSGETIRKEVMARYINGYSYVGLNRNASFRLRDLEWKLETGVAWLPPRDD